MIGFIRFSWMCVLMGNGKQHKALNVAAQGFFGRYYSDLANLKTAECHFRLGDLIKSKEIFNALKYKIKNSKKYNEDTKNYVINYVDSYLSIIDGNRNLDQFLLRPENLKIKKDVAYAFFVKLN
jgi:hypothetical protein